MPTDCIANLTYTDHFVTTNHSGRLLLQMQIAQTNTAAFNSEVLNLQLRGKGRAKQSLPRNIMQTVF